MAGRGDVKTKYQPKSVDILEEISARDDDDDDDDGTLYLTCI